MVRFAGIEAGHYPAIPREQQFAEKIHAYTLPRADGIKNSRTKDLVDMILLIQTETMNEKNVVSAINATFKRRASHQFSQTLLPPPDTWKTPFAEMAKESNLSDDMDKAFAELQKFISKLRF